MGRINIGRFAFFNQYFYGYYVSVIFRKFDFKTMQIEPPVLVAVYFFTFIMAIYFIFKKDKPAS